MVAGVVMSRGHEVLFHPVLHPVLPLCRLVHLVSLGQLSLCHVGQALVQGHVVPLLHLLVFHRHLQLNIHKPVLIWENPSSVLPRHGDHHIPPKSGLVCQDAATVPTLHVPWQQPLPPALSCPGIETTTSLPNLAWSARMLLPSPPCMFLGSSLPLQPGIFLLSLSLLMRFFCWFLGTATPLACSRAGLGQSDPTLHHHHCQHLPLDHPLVPGLCLSCSAQGQKLSWRPRQGRLTEAPRSTSCQTPWTWTALHLTWSGHAWCLWSPHWCSC